MKSVIADYRTRVLCLRIVPVNGSPVYLTQYPVALDMGGHTYVSVAGSEFSGVSATAAMSATVVDLSGFVGLAGIGVDEIASGMFDGARCYLFATSWTNPVEDEEPIIASVLGKTTISDDKYTIEEMSLVDLLGQSVGKTYTASCSRKFGDDGCTMDLDALTVTGTLTGVTSHSVVTDSARTEAADYFTGGTLRFTSGSNANLAPLTVKSFYGGVLETIEPFYYLPQSGDGYGLVAGGRKRLAECKGWGNVINFFGFSFIPLGSQYAAIGTR